MTLDQVRRVVLSLTEVTEEPHFNYTSFRVCGKIFATAPPEGEYLHVFVDRAQRERALADHPDSVETLVWGRQVRGVRVLLPAATLPVVDKLLAQAWAGKAPRRLLAASKNETTSVATDRPD